MSYVGFYNRLVILNGFYSRFYQVLLGLNGFEWFLPGFTGFYRVLLGLNGFELVLLGFCWVLLDWTEFNRV